MKKTKRFLAAILVSFAFTAIVHGQNSDSLINELKRELFPQSNDTIPLYSYLVDSCSNRRALILDSSIYIRKVQPNYHRTLRVLEQIYWAHDTLIIAELLSIYSALIEMFKKEFSEVHLRNFRRAILLRSSLIFFLLLKKSY